MTEPVRRGLVGIEPTGSGFEMVCDCGTATVVTTVREDADGRLVPTLPTDAMEFAVTCDGCGTPHWMKFIVGPEEPDSTRKDTSI